MSNEITYNQNLQINNGLYQDQFRIVTASANQNTQGGVAGVYNVMTTPSALPYSALASGGFTAMTNLDPVNVIQFGVPMASGGFAPVGEMLAGESCQFRLANAYPLYVQALGAPSNLQYLVLSS